MDGLTSTRVYGIGAYELRTSYVAFTRYCHYQYCIAYEGGGGSSIAQQLCRRIAKWGQCAMGETIQPPTSYGLATNYELAAKLPSQNCELGHPIGEPGILLDRVQSACEGRP